MSFKQGKPGPRGQVGKDGHRGTKASEKLQNLLELRRSVVIRPNNEPSVFFARVLA